MKRPRVFRFHPEENGWLRGQNMKYRMHKIRIVCHSVIFLTDMPCRAPGQMTPTLQVLAHGMYCWCISCFDSYVWASFYILAIYCYRLIGCNRESLIRKTLYHQKNPTDKQCSKKIMLCVRTHSLRLSSTKLIGLRVCRHSLPWVMQIITVQWTSCY